jgi:hypothetical protein
MLMPAALAAPASTHLGMQTSLSCSTWCADLRVLIGRSQLSYVTGDKLTYSTLTTDIDSINALDCFPYDSYRFKGYAQVG